jgi:hypothetical protein
MILTWAERCEKFDDGEIVTNRKIQEVMQEEIDELRKELALQRLSDISQEIENEPVAWMVDGVLFTSLGAALNISFDIEQPCIPLYIRPDEDRDSAIHATGYWKGIEYKRMRELTDEEIDEVWVETCSDFKLIENGKTKGVINIYDVSRAILKKASEK